MAGVNVLGLPRRLETANKATSAPSETVPHKGVVVRPIFAAPGVLVAELRPPSGDVGLLRPARHGQGGERRVGTVHHADAKRPPCLQATSRRVPLA